MNIFDHPDFDGHESVVFARDESVGLRAIIALHSTRLGPATGGCRVWRYASEADALKDALRLSQGMTYKNAAAGLDLGGGKAVILLQGAEQKTPELMRAFGRAVERLDGAYITAEDVGVNPDDMAIVRQETRHVGGLVEGIAASGDPSPFTARGVFQSIETGLRSTRGDGSVAGMHVAVQGLGHVGWNLCELLHFHGARLTVADIDKTKAEKAAKIFKASIACPDRIHETVCDVFSPCAMGGIVSPSTISQIKAHLIVGAANNQLETADLAQRLHEKRIIYLPDFIVNAGGIMNVAAEIAGVPNAKWIEMKLEGLQRQLALLLEKARTENRPPLDIAQELVRERLAGTLSQ